MATPGQMDKSSQGSRIQPKRNPGDLAQNVFAALSVI